MTPAAPSPAPSPLHLPSPLVWALSVIGALLSGLLRSHLLDVFGLTADNYVAVALGCVVLMVGPITGAAFRTLIHVSAAVATALQTGEIIVGVLIVQIHDATLSAILIAALTFLGALGFGPNLVAGEGVISKLGARLVVWR